MTQTMPDHAVIIDSVEKTYAASGKAPAKTALHGIDLKVPRGSIFGLLGPNGAGKSTLINIMAGLVRKSEGAVEIWGADLDDNPRQASANIGIVPQELIMDPFFTPREVLELQAGLYGVPKSERKTMQLLEAVGLGDKADAYARTLSGGMKRRLMVAKAMVHNPPILVLDEPTAGVDIELRKLLWEQVVELNKKGTTILLTTHYLEEAQELCDEIAIINHGQLIVQQKTKDLLKTLDKKTLLVDLFDELTVLPASLEKRGFQLVDCCQIRYDYRPSNGRLGEVLQEIKDEGLKIKDVSTQETDLEDIFLTLTRKTA